MSGARKEGTTARATDYLAFLAVALLSIHLAVRERPTAHADSAEYLLTAESLFNHGTLNVQPADLLSFGRIAVRHPLEGDFGRPLSHYLSAPDRRLYGVHFWAYKTLVLPAKLLLRLGGGNEFKAFQVTNVLFALAALGHVLSFSGLSRSARRLLATLLVASPFLPFLLWPHPEVVTGALVTSSLVFRHDGRRVATVLAMALASLRAAPLALAAAFFWAEGHGRHGASVESPAYGRSVVSPWRSPRPSCQPSSPSSPSGTRAPASSPAPTTRNACPSSALSNSSSIRTWAFSCTSP
jgi:hypothetical protein